ncbi:acyltransferase family protein [Nocardiopsis sp. MG754419]|uniref:acyltransferase family protein n=1 Tax=Nocardiopsis sp. MG754419 TaxID=2259865 RepID=UPI001BAE0836|nr:acyltransferase family protein [Nocardiopsis sp. MG754419]MBR8743602.1 acyltransferase [Nocardiopsis sp. MG754419]
MSVPAHSRVTDVVATPVTAPTRARRRSDIEGLRAVAALLIAVYHIWFGTVSGGVDVFLLLTGFLITGSLVRAMERDGRIAFGAFWTKLVKRLFPAGAVVLGAVLAMTYLFFPRSQWTTVIEDVRAAALYYGNWHLALDSVDYMADNAAASPVQHFWSLAVQGQFYLVWPVVITAAGLIAVRLGTRIRRAALVAVGTVFAASLVYSLWITATAPVWAYFDTGARLWEPALGGVLALVVHRVNLPGPVRLVAGWVGLVALVLCGLVIGDALPYPGYASLWPTTAALLIILAGAGTTENGRLSANRLLGLPPLTWLGGHAYTLFLWHWPVLIVYLELTERVRPSLTGGLMVLGASFAAALLTSRLVDGGVARATRRLRAPSWSLAAGVLFVIPVLVAASLWSESIERDRQLRLELSSNPLAYPGATVHLNPEMAAGLPELPIYPDTTTVARDTVDQTRECNALADDTTVVTCAFGDPDSDYTIVMVGSSHVRHWFQAMRTLADQHGWRLVTMTKNACQFSSEEQEYRGLVYTECSDWNEQVMDELAEMAPEAVFTLASLTDREVGEHVPDGFVHQWQRLDLMGIDVIAIRDTPRFDFRVPDCTDRNDRDECSSPQAESMAVEPPFRHLANVPHNTRFLDMTDYLCEDGTCHGVIGNQLVFYDTNHLSYAFSQSLAVVMEPQLLDAVGQAVPTSEPTLFEAAMTLQEGEHS